ncbi:hypothetical protein GHT07_06080 [Caenimonas koreensis DSM 17982]|uniref:Acyltransferase family protein n=1 Tax=Caenimonas koreensis DSM 17982 TaxID=1121255 RepID=A0A844ARG9_9BURK|nr:hypothetical protein [Caenimonas koreensis]MRD46835.1 hypothetical protein [Caenimonas koreensis DSM 17982]
MQRSHEIDALRGLAIISVLLAHFRVLVPVDWAIYDWFRIVAYMIAPRFAARIPLGRILCIALLLMLLAVPARILTSGVAYTVVGLLGGGVVLIGLAGKGWVPDPAGVLSWIGRRSYGLYLAHGPCIAATLELQLPAPARVVVWLALTLGVTELLYRYVELPLIAQGKRRAQALEAHPRLDTQAAATSKASA